MTLRVVHWGTGKTGKEGLRGVIGSSSMELVGLVVERPENVGKDAGDLCDRPKTGIIATNSIEEALALKPDCLSYFGSGVEDLDKGLANIFPFLEAGINVVSTTFCTIPHPEYVAEPHKSRIAEACKKGNASFFTSGVEPGFATDVIPMAVICAADRVDHVITAEIAKYGTYPSEYSTRYVMGLGLPYDQEPIYVQGDFITRNLGGTAQEIANALNVKIDGVRQWHEYAPMPHDDDFAFGHVEKGTRGALLAACDAMYKGKPLVTVMHVNYLFRDYPKHWPQPQFGTHTVYRTDLIGRPSCVIEAAYGLDHGEYQAIIATAMRAINAIPAVVAAPPKQLSGLEVPAIFSGHVRG